jgi:type II secretory ATPase GspE/PulE/Tfp pilus assembly ATPase PilB-like protein/RNA polymerase subunit RPABC4/transcription elongation factor Spt4
MCNLIIHDAILSRASDVHIEPTLHDVQVRMRVDGVLRDYTRAPKWLHGPVVSRLKILAKLDIAERRMPQDGRVNVRLQGRSIDLRVSTLPTHFGEKMVLRVLGSGSAPRIDGLGLSPDQQRILEAALQQPQGMILVTGPTGSGKTTTLYALLASHLNAEVNIVTVEDPIEYQMPRISQVQINPKAGLTFASALRSILRQDPDVILVGEMRDKETAEIAFQAAMTGHLVLSTLHTNSAIGAIGRMFDLDVDPSIMATSLTLVVAQRLVRRLCLECREQYTPEAAVLARAGLVSDDGPIYRGRGCTACGGTGYSGRVGVYEVFRPTNTIRKLINDRASEAELRSASRQMGMVQLREDALDKVRTGMTSPDEVLRVVQADDNEVPCPSCNAIIETVFSTCPYCKHSLKKLCANCEQPLKFDWKLCPYCNSDAQVQLRVEDLGDARQDRRAGASAQATEKQPGVARIEEDPWGLVIEPEAMNAEAPVAVTPERRGRKHASLPAAPLPPAAADVLAPVEGTVDPGTGRRLLRVMVVDDDPDIRMIVSAALHKLPVAVEVVQAEDGVDAVEKADAAAPDLVVLDVMMPRMDGFETCRALRENVRTAFVPILMLTASADQNSRTKGYLIGTDDYMSKPFLPADLVLRVTRLLRRTYGI